MVPNNIASTDPDDQASGGWSLSNENSPVPPINRILRKTMLIIWVLVAGGLLATTVLTSKALYKWELATINSVLGGAHSPAKMAVESLDSRRGQALTDGLLRSDGIFKATLIDDYGSVMGHSERPPPTASMLLKLIRLFWPETTVRITRNVAIYEDRQAQLIVDAVLGASTGGLVEASLMVLIGQAVLITIVAGWTVHFTATMPLIKGLRVLSGWVHNTSRDEALPLPPPQDFKFMELHANALFIQRILADLFEQKQDLAKTVQDLEVQINLNKQYIHIINQILASTNKTAVHIDKQGEITVYNRDTFIHALLDEVSPAVFLKGADVFINQLNASDQVTSVTSAGDISKQPDTGNRLLMDIDVTLVDGRIIQFTGLELGTGDHALMISDQTQARAFAQENFQRQKLEAMGVLASGVAHDLNNILAIISGAIELELNINHDADSKHNLQSAYSALQHGASVVRSLLRFSRKDIDEVETFSAKSIIDDLLLLVQGKIGGEVEIVSVVKDADAIVQVDRSRLSNALLNLAINARDAINGKGQIQIITRSATLADDLPSGGNPDAFVVFEVSDNGPGIPEHLRSRIMDPFFTTKSRDKGTGLGLSLVYNVAETFGGKLSFRNNLHVGATFSMALPRAKPENDVKAAPQETSPASLPPVCGGRVLFIEDETRIATLANKYLTSRGYNVVNAYSVSSVQNILEDDDQFDVIITDLNLGDGTGFEVATHVNNKLASPPPLILISGNMHYGAFEQPTSMFAGSLEKPFALSDLAAMIHNLTKTVELTD